MIEIRNIGEDQTEAVKQLLASCQLPHEDLSFMAGEFIGLYEGENLVGCGGMERYGNQGLLRSIALAATLRGQQHGKQIVRHLEQLGIEKGLTALYLLTETASQFFSRQNYKAITRDEVPDALKASTEFSYVCPSTAVVMVKHLTAPS